MNRNFDEKELEIVGSYPFFGTSYGYEQYETPKFNLPVTPRENFELFKSRKPLYWIVNQGRDFNIIYPDIIPDCWACGFQGGMDSFGVEWIPVKSNDELPSFVKPGNPKLKDIVNWRNLEFPKVTTWDWEESSKKYKAVLSKERLNCGIVLSSYFERLISLMDFEGAAMAMVEETEEVASFMEALCDYNIEIIEHYKKYYNVDLIIVHDDWGAQRSPFFSVDTLKETIIPAYTRMTKRAHDLGVFVMHHCCGNSEGFIPMMIEMGADCWQAQINANPNIIENINKYSKDIFFDLYDFLSVDEDVRADEYREAIEKYVKKFGDSITAMSLDINDWNFGLSTEGQRIAYEISRKVTTNELI